MVFLCLQQEMYIVGSLIKKTLAEQEPFVAHSPWLQLNTNENFWILLIQWWRAWFLEGRQRATCLGGHRTMKLPGVRGWLRQRVPLWGGHRTFKLPGLQGRLRQKVPLRGGHRTLKLPRARGHMWAVIWVSCKDSDILLRDLLHKEVTLMTPLLFYVHYGSRFIFSKII